MTPIKIPKDIYEQIKDLKNGSTVVLTTQVKRMPRQTFLSQQTIDRAIFELPEFRKADGWIQLWHEKEKRNSITCVTCPLIEGPYHDSHKGFLVNYVFKDDLNILGVITGLEVENAHWKIEFTFLKSIKEEKHNIIHSLLSYDEIAEILPYIRQLEYKDIKETLPKIYHLVQSKKVTLKQFQSLIVYYYGSLD